MTCEALLWHPQHIQLLLLTARRGAVWCQVALWLRSRLLSSFLAMNGYLDQSLQTPYVSVPVFTSLPAANRMQPRAFTSSASITSYQNNLFVANTSRLEPEDASSIVVPSPLVSTVGVNPLPQATNPPQLPSSLIGGLHSVVQQQLLQQYVNIAFNNARFDPHSLNCSQLADVARKAPDCANNYLSVDVSKQVVPIVTVAPGSAHQVDKATEAIQLNQQLPHTTVAMQQARGTKRPIQDWVAGGPYQKQARSDVAPGQHVYATRQVHSTAPNSAPRLRPKEYDQISEVICKYHSRVNQTQDLYISKMNLRDALYAIMKDVFPYCGLYVVGSSMNGFGSNSSDMDLCLMLCHSQIDQKREATEILNILYKALRKCLFLKQVLLIRAKVPILKFTDAVSRVECDLNVNNSVGIRNTHLLNSYSKMDVRLAPLVVFAKHWAKTQSINDAKNGTISSYSLVLMIIHFLQCGCSPPVLTSLQQEYPERFDKSKDIRLLSLNEPLPPYSSRNTESVGELFIGFLRYYAHEFDFSNLGISIRQGCTMPRYVISQQDTQHNPPGQWKCLCIEEPFDLSNTARSVYNDYVFLRIQRVFRRSYDLIMKTSNVQAILQQPL
ncbi:hypothetical protein NP493_10g07028 [Ridgeia piscesae]|uniref:PAP-associated domain-containing protein n=1 Tax=Ridgeia piscesae TaxID=27915 RepID=A0AAD9PEY0_RIDPI|nr:hypothetical protein NP493_10g07028 [Ridgeia piscesae]